MIRIKSFQTSHLKISRASEFNESENRLFRERAAIDRLKI